MKGPGVGLELDAKVAIASSELDGDPSGLDHRYRESRGVHQGAASARDPAGQGFGAGHEPAEGSHGLREGAHVKVDLIRDSGRLGRSGATLTQDQGPVRLVDQEHGIVA